MGIGNLHKVVVFKQNTPSALGAGAVDSYSTLLTTRGSLKKLNGSRGLSYGELLETNSFELITRFQSSLESNLRMDVRVEIDGRNFSISSWERLEEKRFYYRFILNEQHG